MHPLGTVGDEPGKRSSARVDPHECRSDQTELHRVEAELALEQREDGIDRLPVGIVKKADKPEHGHDLPTVGAALKRCCSLHEQLPS